VSDDPYVYPGTRCLINKLGIIDAVGLDAMERRLVIQRAREGVPAGNFDLSHLCAIHKHLFQDIYDWAGEVRTVEISKGKDQFQFKRFITTGMADVHRRIVASDYLRGLSAEEFSRKASEIMGDINYVHPFREGNGRAQLQYLKQLAEQAGHPIDLTRFPSEGWIGASRAAHQGDYGPLARAFGGALTKRVRSRRPRRR